MQLQGGSQPLKDETGMVWCAVNGEIYNQHEIKRDIDTKVTSSSLPDPGGHP